MLRPFVPPAFQWIECGFAIRARSVGGFRLAKSLKNDDMLAVSRICLLRRTD
jgi:hypothetical protein